jgi:hypothetical protein
VGSRRVGGQTSSVEYSPGRILRMARSRKRQERRWAALAGPVMVTSRKAKTQAGGQVAESRGGQAAN